VTALQLTVIHCLAILEDLSSLLRALLIHIVWNQSMSAPAVDLTEHNVCSKLIYACTSVHFACI
jgi:hypothetical protein